MKREVAWDVSLSTPAKHVDMRAVYFLLSVLRCTDIATPVGDGLISHYSRNQIDTTKPFHLHDSQNMWWGRGRIDVKSSD